MTKILGLDLGTNSIGWAIVEKTGDEFSLQDKGVRIFSEGVKYDNGKEASRAAERTGYRSARKIKFRRKLRKYETLKVLAENNMCPLSLSEVESYRKSGFKHYPTNPNFINWLRTNDVENVNPYTFRDLASREKTDLEKVGRALYHIAQRRGFLSNRLDQSDEGILEENCPIIQSLIEDLETHNEIKETVNDYFENKGIFDNSQKSGFIKDQDEGDKVLIKLYKSLYAILSKNDLKLDEVKIELLSKLNQKENLGKVKGSIHDLTAEMKDKGFSTLGQLFHSRYNNSKIRGSYTAREEHYLKEFEVICKIQKIGKINDLEKLPEKKYEGLAKDLYKAIFYQRPLKSQKSLIGKCSFEPTKSRCAISHPDFEEFRMWTYLNTIKIGLKGEILRFLSQEEKERIIPKFYRKKDNFNFEDLAKELVPNKATFGYYNSSRKDSFDYWFNYNTYDSVSGCPVSASLKSVFGENWRSIQFEYSTSNSKGEIVNRTVNSHDLWHLLMTSSSDEFLIDFAITKLKLDTKTAKAFSKIRLKKDFASLSLNAIRKITPYIKQGLLYSHAVFMANLEKIVEPNLWSDTQTRLEIQEGIGEIISNHTLDNALVETINGLIKNAIQENANYSKESDPIFRKEFQDKLGSLVKRLKIENQLKQIEEKVTPILIEQLKKLEFLKIDRIDDKVKAFLSGNNCTGQVFCVNEKHLTKIYHPSDIEKFKLKEVKDEKDKFIRFELGSPLSSSIKNPMAMRALHQLRKVLNALIAEGKIDQKTNLHIEMARELNDANKRKGIQDFQKENRENRLKYIEEIKKLYKEETKKEVNPTEDDILRYQLWVEQNRKEIYEPSLNGGIAKSISIAQIIGSNPDYDIEHTVPRSRSQDNSLANKTLCSKHFNREIKKNSMPSELKGHELIVPFVQHWKTEAEALKKEIDQLSRRIKGASTKEAKDKNIRRRHFLNFKKMYLEEKYENFVRLEPKVGFKNSQIPDTGLITRYAQSYLRSYFNKVVSMKGGMVAEFRKQWGIQKSYLDENGQKHYEIKDRSKHTHHTIDAITIACMTKEKYDVLAHFWVLEDEQKKKEAKAIIEKAKPWKTFAEDLMNIEDEILVSHFTPDNLKVQSKKIIRNRGKKQFVAEVELDSNNNLKPKLDLNGKVIYKLDEKGKRIPRLQQGDTVRGSLHQDTIYGRVIDPQTNEIRSVIRKSLESLKASDIEKIVDPEVKEKVKKAIDEKVILLSTNAQQPNKIDKEIGVWMNKEKGIAINKVRIYADSVKNPLEIKKHVSLSLSKFPHKQFVYGQNDENFALAVYEGFDKNGNVKRGFETINNKDAGLYFRLSNIKSKETIVPMKDIKTDYSLSYLIKKGDMVLFYDKTKEELLELNKEELSNRLYKLSKFDAQGRLTFRFHKEARQASDLKEVYQVNFEKPFEQIRLQVSKLNILLENRDFKISSYGEIKFYL